MLYTTTPTTATLEIAGRATEFQVLREGIRASLIADAEEDLLTIREAEALEGLAIALDAITEVEA